MSMEQQSRGAEPPVAGTAPASADGVKMQILSTEHWSLLTTRSLGSYPTGTRINVQPELNCTIEIPSVGVAQTRTLEFVHQHVD